MPEWTTTEDAEWSDLETDSWLPAPAIGGHEWKVRSKNRTLEVGSEDHTLEIDAEDRTLYVVCEEIS